MGRTHCTQGTPLLVEDYVNDTGLIICGKCRTRKQHRVEILGAVRTVSVLCDCEREAAEAEEAYFQAVAERKRIEGLARDACTFSHDTAWREATFARDDGLNPQASAMCRRYVSSFATMQAENTGLLFVGPVGTGKSFLAGCVANALLAKGTSVGVTSLPQILYLMRDFSKKDVLEKLQGYELLVIDDLGTERETSYAAEQVFQVIDARLRTRKPLLVTTNLGLEVMREANDSIHARVYDRVLEMCPVHVVLMGRSRRHEVSEKKKVKAAHWLFDGP
ncbi:MAG: DNA replication protein DnaC [Firmicutes bacterium]|nr:DNA replication protein DnaC [candidate division NPL-UPA2 bacterium]